MPAPGASSTPSRMVLRSRKGIHENNEQNISNASPIEKGTSHDFSEQQRTWQDMSNVDEEVQGSDNVGSDGSAQNSDSENYDSQNSSFAKQEPESEPETNSLQEHDTSSTNYYKYGFIVVFVLLFALYVYPQNDETLNNSYNFTEDFKRVQTQFKTQEEEFWPGIRVGIEEIIEFNQPRVIIFLYENESMAITKSIITEVSKAAVCHLSDCLQEPIDIEGSMLNTTEIEDDYGSIVSNYREKLKKSGVFIIQNLELVPGKSAQALHLFCDEYNPVVNRALFLFTVKVDKLPDKYTATSSLERLLLEAWNDIGVDDKFDPLFTRISGTILNVRPQ